MGALVAMTRAQMRETPSALRLPLEAFAPLPAGDTYPVFNKYPQVSRVTAAVDAVVPCTSGARA